jgi:hypothetical protein
MYATPFETRCRILNEISDPAWAEENAMDGFVEAHDLGLPLAVSVTFELAVATPKGVETLNATWNSFCDIYEVDPYAPYADLDAVISP